MTRLELLKEEYETIRNLRTLSFDLLARVSSYYAHEIECIEKFGSPNPEVKPNEKKLISPDEFIARAEEAAIEFRSEDGIWCQGVELEELKKIIKEAENG